MTVVVAVPEWNVAAVSAVEETTIFVVVTFPVFPTPNTSVLLFWKLRKS
jgi:hypothetical protein